MTKNSNIQYLIPYYILASIGFALGYCIAAKGIAQVEFWEEIAVDVEGNVASISGESEGTAKVGIVVCLCVPVCISLFGYRDICLAIR